ncbi:MAG: LysR family transcriptional regulator [Burkholderiaceae bacterium]|nr:LysR family transcriptional regulator [Burkholderiaceae bacterium]
MLPPRRFLPSTSLLSAFEAAARTGSFSAAARELALTQSAISRQIKALEQQLGVALFVRERQTVRLTDAGLSYERQIRDALTAIATASLNLRANPGGGTLELAILPTFGTRWLAPRLPRFLAKAPGITINLTTRLRPFDFAAERLDAAIHHGLADWPGAEHAYLHGEIMLPACAPEMRAQSRFRDPGDLAGVPLIHLATRPDDWVRWFRANGARQTEAAGMIFDQFAMVAQAAMAGLGVALLPTLLIRDELASGDLVPALDLPFENDEAYYLVWPRERGSYPPLRAFRDWLTAEAQRPDG